jgi:P27 family predicted phage terminase small subunit
VRTGTARSDPGRLPLPPQDGLSDRARDTWTRLAPLVPDGRLTEATADMFAMLCTQIATWREAEELVQETGILTVAGQDLVTNPALSIRDHADSMTARWAKAFGIAPDSPQAAMPQGRTGPRHLREA